MHPVQTETLSFDFDQMWERIIEPFRKSILGRTKYHAGDRDQYGRAEVSERLAVRRFKKQFNTEPEVVLEVTDGFFVACA